MSDITQVVDQFHDGSSASSTELLPLVYDELRKLAAARLSREIPGQTLQPTALVHEAYVRLVQSNPSQIWCGRGHFFAAAAEAMRRILIERAKQKRSIKGGGGFSRVEIIDLECPADTPVVDLLALDDALRKLQARDPRKAELVKLRFFAGLTNRDAAKVLGVSESTADNDWAYARCWLRLAMSGETD